MQIRAGERELLLATYAMGSMRKLSGMSSTSEYFLSRLTLRRQNTRVFEGSLEW